MILRADAIVERLELIIGLDGNPQRLRTAIEEQLIQHFQLPAIQAAEKAEAFENLVSRLISRKCDQATAEGTISPLTLIGSSQDVVAGSCKAFPGDSLAVAQAKANRLHAKPLLGAIQTLTFTDFERFGARVLTELGAQKVKVTPHAGDQGIDFFGVLNLGQLQQAPPSFFQLAHDVEIRFAGQAKHYPHRSIGPSTIRELVGAVSLARTKTFSADRIDLFEELNLRPLSPLLSLLFTTGSLSLGATHLAREAGIIARSGIQLAVFLADRGVGMRPGAAGAHFDVNAFTDWLNQ
jgi:Restriction endonuclease